MKPKYLIIFGTSIITLSIIVNIIYPKKWSFEYLLFLDIKPETNWLTQATIPPPKELLTEISDSKIEFKTQIPTQINRMYLEFAILCEPECDQLWLEIVEDQPSNTLTKFLVYHPQLDNLTWFYVSDRSLQFYQKKGEYKTPFEFLNNNTDTVYTEPQIAQLLQIPENRYKNLNELENFQNADYILTSYQFPKNQGKWRVSRAIDVRGIARDNEGFIKWKVIQKNKSGNKSRIWMSEPNIGFDI